MASPIFALEDAYKAFVAVSAKTLNYSSDVVKALPTVRGVGLAEAVRSGKTAEWLKDARKVKNLSESAKALLNDGEFAKSLADMGRDSGFVSSYFKAIERGHFDDVELLIKRHKISGDLADAARNSAKALKEGITAEQGAIVKLSDTTKKASLLRRSWDASKRVVVPVAGVTAATATVVALRSDERQQPQTNAGASGTQPTEAEIAALNNQDKQSAPSVNDILAGANGASNPSTGSPLPTLPDTATDAAGAGANGAEGPGFTQRLRNTFNNNNTVGEIDPEDAKEAFNRFITMVIRGLFGEKGQSPTGDALIDLASAVGGALGGLWGLGVDAYRDMKQSEAGRLGIGLLVFIAGLFGGKAINGLIEQIPGLNLLLKIPVLGKLFMPLVGAVILTRIVGGNLEHSASANAGVGQGNNNHTPPLVNPDNPAFRRQVHSGGTPERALTGLPSATMPSSAWGGQSDINSSLTAWNIVRGDHGAMTNNLFVPEELKKEGWAKPYALTHDGLGDPWQDELSRSASSKPSYAMGFAPAV